MIAAGIVLFNPSIEKLKQCIFSFIDDVDMIYLVDNCSSNILQIEELLRNVDKINFTKLDKNYGIAFALNRIMKRANDDGFDWVLTMDQDSVCPEGMISHLYKYRYYDKIGIIFPLIQEVGCTEKKKYFTPYDKIKMCITAGSLTNVNCWYTVGGFDESLFIDMVDFEFCARLEKNGFNIICVNDVFLLQEIGKFKEIVIGNRHVKVRDHNPMRRYYWSRNIIICHMKHKNFFKLSYTIKSLVVEFAKIVLFEKSKFAKIAAMQRGVLDAISIIMSDQG